MMRPIPPRQFTLPLVPLYRLGLGLRGLGLRLGLEPVRTLERPVVSIGNLSAGGAGKTPFTIALARALRRHHVWVDVLSRGYGRKADVAGCVDPAGSAEAFGDEPLLIARETGVPVYVARQRYDAGVLAESHSEVPETTGSERALHLLDDGFQHRQLARAVDILLVSRRDWQDGLLPAGNLREPRSAARRATILAIPAEEPEFESTLRAWGWEGPVWRLRREMHLPRVAGPVAAFCGIARPEQFFDGLEAGGMRLFARIPFPDHHRYTESDLRRIQRLAGAAGAAALITTGKDRVRLGDLASRLERSLPLEVAGLDTAIQEETTAIGWLLARLQQPPGQASL